MARRHGPSEWPIWSMTQGRRVATMSVMPTVTTPLPMQAQGPGHQSAELRLLKTLDRQRAQALVDG